MNETTEQPLERAALDALVENHRAFLAFLEKRVGRRDLAEDILQEAFARGLDKLPDFGSEESAVAACRCVALLADTLKHEYADALRRVEVDGVSVQDFAREAGITANNAGVRLFRAREALRKRVAQSCGTCADHGCVDCTCRTPAAKPRGS